MTAAPWMELAWAELGQSEVKGALANPRIKAMFADAGHPETTSDEVPWCAAFVGAMLKRSGCEPTGSLMARSYLAWGVPLDEPREGAIAVFKRTSDPSLGHVGYVLSATEDRITIISGNDGNRVQVRDYPRADLIGLRWPSVVGSALPSAKPSPAGASKPVEDAVVVERAAAGTAAADPSSNSEPRRWWDLLGASRTVRGALWSAFGGLLMLLESTMQLLLDGIAAAAKYEPLQATLAAAGANTKALGFGFLCWGVTLTIARRFIDEGSK